MKAIVVEDDRITREYIIDILKKNNFEVFSASSGEEGLRIIEKNQPSLIILDINLFKMTGYDVCYFIRKYPEKYGDIKIFMLTERTDHNDIVKGFKAGADDYLKKPFHEEEFLLRVFALMKRDLENSKDVIKYKTATIIKEQFTVIEDGVKTVLTKIEMELLYFMIINKGLLISKDKIFSEIWGREYEPGNKTVDVCLTRLKKKLTWFGENISSYKGIGYKVE